MSTIFPPDYSIPTHGTPFIPPPPPPKEDADNVETIMMDRSEIGMTAETKDLFREDPRGAWEEWAMEDIGLHSTSEPASAKFALIVRREKRNGRNGEPVIALHSITVQSDLIKAQLGSVFAGYPGINTNLKDLDFSAPFREFCYRWYSFLEASPTRKREAAGEGNDVDDGDVSGGQFLTTQKHYDLLFSVLKPEITPHMERINDLLRNGVISFDYLWALFEPGTEIYSKVNGHDRLLLLNSGHYQDAHGMKVYVLTCRYIDTDGTNFGYATTSLAIPEFENLIPHAELTVLPSHLKEGMPDIKARLKERGRKFEKLNGLHYKAYSGKYQLARAPPGGSSKQTVINGRMIVDCASFNQYNSNAEVPLAPLNIPLSSTYKDSYAVVPYMEASDAWASAIGPVAVLQVRARAARGLFASGQQSTQCTPNLSKEHYVMCTGTVKGYALMVKEWVYLDVDLLEDIQWNEHAFKHLVLPHDYKRMIWAFVEAQLTHVDAFDDIIEGKGKGIIMLLSGEPGTGKTLTSESVSEAMKKPLYSMGAGELGNTAEEVETELRQVLELSARWDAVLLLDECDVFLEKRSTSDLQRNKLVSVFLRLLEYYAGVMFLTTNRVESFDPAFESRIHLTINYPKLNELSRLHIWRTFLDMNATTDNGVNGKETGCGISEDELLKLAREELNGRQIKNLVKTARLLAAQEKKVLGTEHLQTVLRVKRACYADE